MIAEQETAVQFPTDTDQLKTLIRQIYNEERAAEKAGKKTMSKQEMYDALLALPNNEKLRDYETTVAKEYADKWSEKSIHGELKELINLITAKPAVGSADWKVAFGAFAVAVNFERLNKNVTEEETLLNKYRSHFAKEHIFFFHLDVLCRMGQVEAKDARKKEDVAFLEQLLFDAMKNSTNLEGDTAATSNYGGHHAFAELTAELFETKLEYMHDFLTDPTHNWLEHARDSAKTAIDGSRKYAKYHCTLGRVLAQMGNWEEAISSVTKAIDLEDSTRTDYAIRIGDYTSYRQQFRAQQSMLQQKAVLDAKVQDVSQQMDDQEKNMTDRMETQEKETMAKNMEFLGLFSGIVSFTIGSLTLASNFKSEDAIKIAGLIVVLLGALMCVFSAFGMILHGFFVKKKDKKTEEEKNSFIWRHVVVFVLGALIVIGGIVFCIK